MNHQQAMGLGGGQQPGGGHSAYGAGGPGQAMPALHQSQQPHQAAGNQMYLQEQAGPLPASQQPMLSGQPMQQQQQQQQHSMQPPLGAQQHHGAGPLQAGSSHHSSSRSQQMYGGSGSGGAHHQHGSHRSAAQQHYGGGGGGSHRGTSNMMHQHRSSAAAISDPMMAGGITGHLASASGPLTGSGGALNQLGQPYGSTGYSSSTNAGYPPPSLGAQLDPLASGPAPGGAYRQAGGSSWAEANFDAGPPPMGPLGAEHHGTHHLSSSHHQQAAPQHQSRYDAHYSGAGSSGRRHQSQQHHFNATDGAFNAAYGLQSHSQPPYGSQYMQQAGLDYPASGGGGRSHPPPAPMPPMNAGYGPQMPAGQGGLAGAYGPQPSMGGAGIGGLEVTELRARLQELQVSYANVKRELEMVTQKLGSSMHSIKSFWSPELKKERALRKEEQTKYALINDQMKMMRVEVQVRLAHAHALLSSWRPTVFPSARRPCFWPPV